MADDSKKNPKTPEELVKSVLDFAVLAGHAETETDAEKKKKDLKEAEDGLKADLAALENAVKAKDSKTALTKEDVKALREQIVPKVREAAKEDSSLDVQAIIDTKFEEALQKSTKEIQDKAGKEKDPELTLFNIIKAASDAGHKKGVEAEEKGEELPTDGLHGDLAAKLLADVEAKLKGDNKDKELEGDAQTAFATLKNAVDQAAVRAAEAGKEGKHFLVDASLDKEELEELKKEATVKALKGVLPGADKVDKIFHAPTEEKPRTKDPLPAQEAQEAKDGKKAVEAREAEKPGVYDSVKALEQARAAGQTASKGAMVGNAALVAAGLGVAATAMRSGGNSSPDPRNPNAEQGKKRWGFGRIAAVTLGAAAAAIGIAALLRKENPMQTVGAFTSMVTGGRLGGGAAQGR